MKWASKPVVPLAEGVHCASKSIRIASESTFQSVPNDESGNGNIRCYRLRTSRDIVRNGNLLVFSMTSINVDNKDKEKFDEMQPEDSTQAEFFHEMIRAKERDNGEIVDVDKLVENIEKRIATKCELSSYRGTKEALERYYNDQE